MVLLHAIKKLALSFSIYSICIALFSGCAPEQTPNSQTGDDQWSPSVSSPEYRKGGGPVVLVDAALESGDAGVTAKVLNQASVYVISNAVYGGDSAEWKLPTPSAFMSDEIEAIVTWVAEGGSLLLIADHMPMPGATEDLANEFGIVFLNGFAMKSAQEGGTLSFTQSSGSLADHAITRGRTESERVESVMAFTGQAFRFVSPVQPLMIMPDDWQVLLPAVAWEFDETTPTVSARGLIQGGVLPFGAGRVAVFGEAAMFTAQTSVQGGVAYPMGMNHPAATENAQFVLNVIHWLTEPAD
jgi:hypothetical protein